MRPRAQRHRRGKRPHRPGPKQAVIWALLAGGLFAACGEPPRSTHPDPEVAPPPTPAATPPVEVTLPEEEATLPEEEATLPEGEAALPEQASPEVVPAQVVPAKDVSAKDVPAQDARPEASTPPDETVSQADEAIEDDLLDPAVARGVCANAHSLRLAGGVELDCYPYRCHGDRCRTSCQRTEDCSHYVGETGGDRGWPLQCIRNRCRPLPPNYRR